MIRVEATIKGDIHFPFSVTWTGINQASPRAKTRHPGSVRDVAAREPALNGSQLVVGCACFLGAAKLLFWAFLRLWLFEP